MKLYIQKTNIQGAWKWINEGYRKAWIAAGLDVYEYGDILEVDTSEDYNLMAWEYDIRNRDSAIEIISRANKTFLFVQPNSFPQPWGRHPNWKTGVRDKHISIINEFEHVKLWTFSDNTGYHEKWKTVHTVPLAFDSIGYAPKKSEKYSQYDVCFVGGWANNGFDEKRKIMIEIFSKFMDSGLKCGFFINKGLTHEQECDLLRNSKISLNIHDAYQRTLGYDTNERTFKSLGLNGVLVSDTVAQLNNLFPDVPTSLDANALVKIAKELLSLTENEIRGIKESNKQDIADNHTYIKRVEQFLKL
jgi:hypothetical protein